MPEKEHGSERSERSRRDESTDDDVQGHRFSEDLTGDDDVQGHRFSEDLTGDDDVAGHVQMTDEEEDTHPRSRG
jgi:hypothetical protein